MRVHTHIYHSSLPYSWIKNALPLFFSVETEFHREKRIYSIGWYVAGYKGTERSDLPGQFDYRCRMSLSGTGCTLSVFDLREAEDMCNGDHECRGFIVTNQRTWIGGWRQVVQNDRLFPTSPQHTYMQPPSHLHTLLSSHACQHFDIGKKGTTCSLFLCV